MARFLSIDDLNLEGKTVLLRVDINCPLNPETNVILDNNRIRMVLPTINRLSQSKIVVIAHQSRPGKKDFISTLTHARELSRLLGRPVQWVEDIHGQKALHAVGKLQNGDILMLNNVRMDPDEIQKYPDIQSASECPLVEKLSSVADVYVNDAFACTHRGSPSMVGFAKHLPCLAGELVKKELAVLEKTVEAPHRPCLGIFGGIKVDDSILVADNMLRNGTCDEIWVVGGVGNLLLELDGVDIGEINHDFLVKELGSKWTSTISLAKSMMRDFREKIVLPVDVAANIEGERVDFQIEKLPVESPLFDIGIHSIRRLSQAIKSAGTIIMNGPAGVFEIDDFALGTIEMLNACAESNAFTIVGGGHTATIVKQRGLGKKMGHVSTGGGACLMLLSGKALPSIVSLEISARSFSMGVEKSVENR